MESGLSLDGQAAAANVKKAIKGISKQQPLRARYESKLTEAEKSRMLSQEKEFFAAASKIGRFGLGEDNRLWNQDEPFIKREFADKILNGTYAPLVDPSVVIAGVVTKEELRQDMQFRWERNVINVDELPGEIIDTNMFGAIQSRLNKPPTKEFISRARASDKQPLTPVACPIQPVKNPLPLPPLAKQPKPPTIPPPMKRKGSLFPQGEFESYEVSKEMQTFLSTPNANMTAKLREEVEKWKSDNWAGLTKPPSWLHIGHFITIMDSNFNNVHMRCQLAMAESNLAMARLISQNLTADEARASFEKQRGVLLDGVARDALTAEVFPMMVKLACDMTANSRATRDDMEFQAKNIRNSAQCIEGINTDFSQGTSAKIDQLSKALLGLTAKADPDVGAVMKGGYSDQAPDTSSVASRLSYPSGRTGTGSTPKYMLPEL